MTDTAAVKTKKRFVSKFHEGDYWLIASTLLLTLFGVVMVFSASYYTGLSKFGDPFYYLKDDIKWMAAGWFIFFVFATVDYHLWKKLAKFILAIGFVLLGMIFLPKSLGLTITINNATRWLNFKFFTVMPGEVIKFCFILFFAYYYSNHVKDVNHPLWGIGIPFGITVFAFVLIYKQPNLSTAGIVVLLALAMMVVAGISWWWVIGAVGVVAVGGGAFVLLKGAGYMLSRIDNFWDPFADSLGKGYQVCQGILAFGSGGVTGLGLGKSIQKALYLPEPMNDFILPIIGEELGFIGVVCLIAVYVFLLWRLFSVGMHAKDRFGMLIASGVAIHIGLQVIINIAVVTASFPPTGVVLPLISLGGTATLLIMGELGIAYNVSKQTKVVTE